MNFVAMFIDKAHYHTSPCFEKGRRGLLYACTLFSEVNTSLRGEGCMELPMSF